MLNENSYRIFASVGLISWFIEAFVFETSLEIIHCKCSTVSNLVATNNGHCALVLFSLTQDLEPGMIAWKGAAVLSFLDTCEELWIKQEEWERAGVRLLRERVPFVW